MFSSCNGRTGDQEDVSSSYFYEIAKFDDQLIGHRMVSEEGLEDCFG